MSVVAKTSAPAAEACPMPSKNTLNPQGIKPCCACPEAKAARDECYLLNDPKDAPGKCAKVLGDYVNCMKSYGFNI